MSANETTEPGQTSGSKRMRQTDAERALAQLLPAAQKFQDKLAELIKSNRPYRLKMEVHGQSGRVKHIEVNENQQYVPHEEPS